LRRVGRRDVADAELIEHLAYGKGLMDRIRVEVDPMRDEESKLLDDRISDVESIRVRDYVSVALALVVPVVRSLHRGHPLPFPSTGKHDELGELESAVHVLAARDAGTAAGAGDKT
jgi:hypothetical protein